MRKLLIHQAVEQFLKRMVATCCSNHQIFIHVLGLFASSHIWGAAIRVINCLKIALKVRRCPKIWKLHSTRNIFEHSLCLRDVPGSFCAAKSHYLISSQSLPASLKEDHIWRNLLTVTKDCFQCPKYFRDMLDRHKAILYLIDQLLAMLAVGSKGRLNLWLVHFSQARKLLEVIVNVSCLSESLLAVVFGQN